mmetsp:Transcript_38359/g.123804  ORF Transcript_38359/g.123804 Transcript_38359/m.123804 type:complete len:302 (+) Transcript_38359:304-1209(+)
MLLLVLLLDGRHHGRLFVPWPGGRLEADATVGPAAAARAEAGGGADGGHAPTGGDGSRAEVRFVEDGLFLLVPVRAGIRATAKRVVELVRALAEEHRLASHVKRRLFHILFVRPIDRVRVLVAPLVHVAVAVHHERVGLARRNHAHGHARERLDLGGRELVTLVGAVAEAAAVAVAERVDAAIAADEERVLVASRGKVDELRRLVDERRKAGALRRARGRGPAEDGVTRAPRGDAAVGAHCERVVGARRDVDDANAREGAQLEAGRLRHVLRRAGRPEPEPAFVRVAKGVDVTVLAEEQRV